MLKEKKRKDRWLSDVSWKYVELDFAPGSSASRILDLSLPNSSCVLDLSSLSVWPRLCIAILWCLLPLWFPWMSHEDITDPIYTAHFPIIFILLMVLDLIILIKKLIVFIPLGSS
jgi:hypothetical protein